MNAISAVYLKFHNIDDIHEVESIIRNQKTYLKIVKSVILNNFSSDLDCKFL